MIRLYLVGFAMLRSQWFYCRRHCHCCWCHTKPKQKEFFKIKNITNLVIGLIWHWYSLLNVIKFSQFFQCSLIYFVQLSFGEFGNEVLNCVFLFRKLIFLPYFAGNQDLAGCRDDKVDYQLRSFAALSSWQHRLVLSASSAVFLLTRRFAVKSNVVK